MGPNSIKEDIFKVITNSRELANYCLESVKSVQSKKISSSLNNFHLKTSIDLITKALTDKEKLFFDLNDVDFSDLIESDNKPIFDKVIDHIQNYFIE